MFKNYLKVAFRNTFKRKGYSLLNIAGLTIGMSCCLLIFHYVSFEKSYDTFEPNEKQIVRVRLDRYQKGVLAYKSATSYPAIGPAMKRDFPEVQDFCRLIDNQLLLSNEQQDRRFLENKGYYADPSAIDMFGLQLIEGDPNTALNAPDKLLLSESTAKKYFGKSNPVGNTLINRNGAHVQTMEVTGVYKDFPSNSHLILNYLVSYSTLGKELRLQGDSSNASETAWGWYDFYVYVQLKPGIEYKQLQAKMPAFTDKYINSIEWARQNNQRTELHLLPIRDIHLYSNYNQEAEVNGSGQAVSFLFLIAVFIICIAWINYINLATARSVERAKEVGIRKVLGALRPALIKQFITESLILNIISLVLSLGIFFAFLRPFDAFTGRSEYSGIALTSNYFLLFLTLFIGGTILSGLYPAVVLSGFRPILVLKGAFKNTTGGLLLRKGLIVVQFVTSVVLIAGTIIVYQQLSYMRNQDLGVDINETLIIKGPQTIADSIYQNIYQPFKTTVLQQPGIKNIASSTSVPGEEVYWTNSWKKPGGGQSEAVTLYNVGVDNDYIASYKIRLLSGRNFSQQFGTDERGVILNENAVNLLGFNSARDAVNQKIINGLTDTLKIIGVTENFHQVGLQKNIDAMVIRPRPNSSAFYSLKVNSGSTQQAIASLKQIWNRFFPQDPFNYFFLDESFGAQYKADVLFGKVFGIFAFLAIVIACFGLVGLSAYNVVQRTKEIGIRKVLGASVQSILIFLSLDFLKLIVISLFLAIPSGWLIMSLWLQEYAYRINIAWWVFVIAGCVALLIAIFAISAQAIKAAVANPVNSLRVE